MAYAPKSPPFSARAKTIGGSLLAEIPVTSVTSTEPKEPHAIERSGDAIGTPAHSALGADARRPASDLCGPAFADLIERWVRERCVVVSPQCASSVHALHRCFSQWATFEIDADVSYMFAEDLQLRGFVLDENGMVRGLVLAADFLAALEHERIHKGLPAEESRNSTKGVSPMPMIITSKEKKFEIPNEGEHLAVLADIVDLGETETAYGLKDLVQFRWQVQQLGSDGKPLSVRQKPHNKSMYEKATLRKDIKRILGKDPGDSFDVETLLGVNSLLEIEHHTREGRTYANIVAIRRPTNGGPVLKIPEDFKRATGNKSNKAPANNRSLNDHGFAVNDSDIPF